MCNRNLLTCQTFTASKNKKNDNLQQGFWKYCKVNILYGLTHTKWSSVTLITDDKLSPCTGKYESRLQASAFNPV